jgi:hypothetical protein
LAATCCKVVCSPSSRDRLARRCTAVHCSTATRCSRTIWVFAIEIVERFGLMDEHPTVLYRCGWSYRALRAGVPIVYAPDAPVGHVALCDRREIAETYRRCARSQGGFYGHYVRRGDEFLAFRAIFDQLRAP